MRAVAARARAHAVPVEQSGAPAPRAAAAPERPRTKVAYHPSCHLARGLGVTKAPVELLVTRARFDLELVPVADADECCGFGGMFSVKQPEISGAMLDRKCRALEASGAEVVASCDAGCLLHLAGGMRRRGLSLRACHVAELLE